LRIKLSPRHYQTYIWVNGTPYYWKFPNNYPSPLFPKHLQYKQWVKQKDAVKDDIRHGLYKQKRTPPICCLLDYIRDLKLK